jgi:hypothetical protein
VFREEQDIFSTERVEKENTVFLPSYQEGIELISNILSLSVFKQINKIAFDLFTIINRMHAEI